MAAVAREFGTSNEVGYLITSMFLVGYIFGPLVWGPGSELVGRQPIMLLTIGAYTFLHLGQALAPNMETMLVTRFLGGFFACAPLVNSGGLIADIWDPAARGLATSMFTAAVFLGPVMGPIGSSL
jgi:DHA1 family multidrug resistance protein-like MFS transporter